MNFVTLHASKHPQNPAKTIKKVCQLIVTTVVVLEEEEEQAVAKAALARRKIKDWLVLGGSYHNSKENSNKCWCSR